MYLHINAYRCNLHTWLISMYIYIYPQGRTRTTEKSKTGLQFACKHFVEIFNFFTKMKT